MINTQKENDVTLKQAFKFQQKTIFSTNKVEQY
jgi:hypothetical protein